MSRRNAHGENGGYMELETPRDILERISEIWSRVLREYEKLPDFSLELEQEVDKKSEGFLSQMLRSSSGGGTDETCKLIAGVFGKAANEIGLLGSQTKKTKLENLAKFFMDKSKSRDLNEAGNLQAKLNKMPPERFKQA